MSSWSRWDGFALGLKKCCNGDPRHTQLPSKIDASRYLMNFDVTIYLQLNSPKLTDFEALDSSPPWWIHHLRPRRESRGCETWRQQGKGNDRERDSSSGLHWRELMNSNGSINVTHTHIYIYTWLYMYLYTYIKLFPYSFITVPYSFNIILSCN